MPGANFQIITGVSAGAINAAFLAAHAHSLPEAVESLGRLWSELRAEQVFRVDPVFFARNLLRCRTTAHAASPSGSGRRPRRRRLPPWHAGEEVAMTIAGVVFALMAGSMLVLVVRALRRRLITPRPSPTAPWRPA